MARPGPTPKPADKRARRNRETFEPVELDAGARIDAPALPRIAGVKWSPSVRRWYRAFCSSPMAAQLLPFDWERVFLIAQLRLAFEATPTSALSAEIRQNEAKLGGTPDDRLRLRWRMANAGGEPEQPPAAPKPRRRRRSDPRLTLVEKAS